MKNIISQITMKELEQITYRALQKSFSEVMAHMLLEMDQAIAEGRDKKRFELKDKRNLKFDSVFGHVSLHRNYYRDRDTGNYVYLLDQYLEFDGGKGMSLVVQELGIELAVTGVSYRQAEGALEKTTGIPRDKSRGHTAAVIKYRGFTKGKRDDQTRCFICRSRWIIYKKPGERKEK